MQLNFNLTHKSILLTVLMVCLTALSIGYYAYYIGTHLLVSHALEELANQVEREEVVFTNQINNLTADVHFLAELPAIPGIFNAPSSSRNLPNRPTRRQWQKRLTIIFSTLMKIKPDYLQIRLLNRHGQEILRVNRINGIIQRTAEAALQNKSDTQYVSDTLALPTKSTYLSQINLNREHGKVSVPYTPVLRAATPIYNHGKLLGMVIINLDMTHLLNRFETAFSNRHQSIFIMNEQGSYLTNPELAKRFGYDLGHRYRIQEDYPRLASLFLSNNNDISRTIIPENDNDNAIVSRKIYLEPAHNSHRFVVIALTRPYADIISAESVALLSTGRILLLLMAVFALLSYFISRQLSKPLQQIAQSIYAFGQTQEYSPLTKIQSRRDEIGFLARAFHKLVDTITTTQQSLQDLNASLESEIEKRTAELQKSEQRWQFALEGAQQGVWDWNIVTNEIYFSRQWKAMLGYADEEISNHIDEWHQRIYPDDMAALKTEMDNHLSGQSALYKNEHRVLCKDGTYKWILDQGMVVERDQYQNPVRMIGTHTDISERKLIDKMKNEFISTVSHELRTPLTSIRGSLGLINGGAAGEIPARAASLLAIAHKNTERLLLLINDILDLQKIESGNMPFEFKTISLLAFISDAIETNRPFAHEQEVELVLNTHLEGDVEIIADYSRLIQVMNNLLSNAAKFSPAASTINVDITVNQHDIIIAIHDQGPGIPEEFRDKLFDKFTQSDASDTRHIGGTGLGLSIARLIVEKHNGTISYDTVMGQGTTFFIHLPALMISESLMHQVSTAHTRDILIIEDDKDIASLLALQISHMGYYPQITDCAEHAWEILQVQTFAAVTPAIALPGQDGSSFLKQLRQKPQYAALPIIVISVRADEARQELSGGAVEIVDWLTKPFDQSDLQRALVRATQTSALPKMLYVEDDADLQQVVAHIIQHQAQLTIASSLTEARQVLEKFTFDLVLLDVALPDGSGLDLLADIKRCPKKPQVVIYSANPVSRDDIEHVNSILLKSQTTNAELLATLKQLLGN